MKVAILGGAGARTPLIVRAFAAWKDRIGLTELTLMDVDEGRLDLILDLIAAWQGEEALPFRLTATTDADAALTGARYVITTFRVGGMASRVVDERVPLRYGVLGQETTGPGGFAMAMRTIPVLLEYVERMRECCPDAWLINFANPAGMLAEAVVRLGGWQRVVGICDTPESMRRVAAAMVGVPPQEVFLDYFGLNHLGWARGVRVRGEEMLPRILDALREDLSVPGLPFDPDFLTALGLIPNEYLFYYYHTPQAVQNILAAERTRGEQILAMNTQLFADLHRSRDAQDAEGMVRVYKEYLRQRGETYMSVETGHRHADLPPEVAEVFIGEGYAHVALELIQGLQGGPMKEMILNLPNQGALAGFDADDVVEVPALVARDLVRPLAVGSIPDHCFGLMKQVKAYERLTLAAVSQHSYAQAVEALALHPLVPDWTTAKAILDDFRREHGQLFPALA